MVNRNPQEQKGGEEENVPYISVPLRGSAPPSFFFRADSGPVLSQLPPMATSFPGNVVPLSNDSGIIRMELRCGK